MTQHNHLRLLPQLTTTATVDEEQVITIRVQLPQPAATPVVEEEDLQLLTVHQVCDLLNVGKTKVYELLKRGPDHGGLAVMYIDSVPRVPRADVRRWQQERLDEQREAA